MKPDNVNCTTCAFGKGDERVIYTFECHLNPTVEYIMDSDKWFCSNWKDSNTYWKSKINGN